MNILINVVNQIVKDLFETLRREDHDYQYTMSHRQFHIKNVERFYSTENGIWMIWVKNKTAIAIDKNNIVSFEVTKNS